MKASPEHQSLLIQLQKLDTEISQLNYQLNNLVELEQIVAIHTRIENGIVERKVVEQELEDVNIDLRRSEVDVEAVTDRLAKDEKRLSSGLGTPKELEQIQHEIETLKKRRSELEDGELEIMLRKDGVQKRLDELTSDEEGLKKLEVELQARIDTQSTELKSHIAEKANTRLSLIPSIDASLVELYEKIRASSDGVGAALLIGNKCDGCHMVITAVELEKIKNLPPDEVWRCDECRRILVRI